MQTPPRARTAAFAVVRTLGILFLIVAPGCSETLTAEGVQPLRLAVIGDYGSGSNYERDVATLVTSWNPDYILTVGDNNYPDGRAETIDRNIGRYYHAYIGNYRGTYGEGASDNRFFPSLGNHDWRAEGAAPYLEYFTLPGNERYYEQALGPVRVFMLDSDPHEPSGTSATSEQANWLRERLAASKEPWRLVLFHHAPFSSGNAHGSSEWMQWPFEEWGASAVIAGHDHHYERVIRDGIPYFVNGLGGAEKRTIRSVVGGSVVRFTEDYGAMRIDVTPSELEFEFVTRSGRIVDSYEVALEATSRVN
jgi:hypothetical protein